MARTLRIEYQGARYHVMCHGNQNRDIFKNQFDADLFIRCLGEMCERNQVSVHAWCLMSNHYHILLETPEGNLVDAMKWFQGTFTQRYNAHHRWRGHLFQGRYKAKVVDDADPSYFRVVSEYIHLNPAEAGLVKPGNLSEYRWSSYPFYLKPSSGRPEWLRVQQVLNAYGIPDDTHRSRGVYETYMNLRHESVAMNKLAPDEKEKWNHMERGWVHGSKEFRDRMRGCLQEQGGIPEEMEQKRDLSEAAALKTLNKCLRYFELTPEGLLRLAKTDPRKMLIAGLLRYHYPVRAWWVSEQLVMGHYTTVSRAMRFYDEATGVWAGEKKQILKFIG